MKMTNETNDHSAELRRIVRMLEKPASMAEHASLTGSMGGGKEVAVRSYNSVVEHLASISEIPAGLFPPLPADANLDSAGIASAQLAEYLREGLPEPEQQQSASTAHRRMRIEKTIVCPLPEVRATEAGAAKQRGRSPGATKTQRPPAWTETSRVGGGRLCVFVAVTSVARSL